MKMVILWVKSKETNYRNESGGTKEEESSVNHPKETVASGGAGAVLTVLSVHRGSS